MTDYGTPKADFLEEAMRILDAAKEREITIRLMGAAAMRHGRCTYRNNTEEICLSPIQRTKERISTIRTVL